MARNSRALEIAAQHGKPLPDVLRTLYVDKGMSMREVASELGVGLNTVHRWFHLYGIPVRHMSWVLKEE